MDFAWSEIHNKPHYDTSRNLIVAGLTSYRIWRRVGGKQVPECVVLATPEEWSASQNNPASSDTCS